MSDDDGAFYRLAQLRLCVGETDRLPALLTTGVACGYQAHRRSPRGIALAFLVSGHRLAAFGQVD
jgi:hypothetical protein